MDLERDERRRPSHIFRFSGTCPPATLGDRDMVRTPTPTPNQRPARPARISFGRTAAAPTIQRYVSNVGRAGEGSARLRNYVKQLPGPIVGSAGASTAASHSSKLHIAARSGHRASFCPRRLRDLKRPPERWKHSTLAHTGSLILLVRPCAPNLPIQLGNRGLTPVSL
jgi:hypothetical protein